MKRHMENHHKEQNIELVNAAKNPKVEDKESEPKLGQNLRVNKLPKKRFLGGLKP